MISQPPLLLNYKAIDSRLLLIFYKNPVQVSFHMIAHRNQMYIISYKLYYQNIASNQNTIQSLAPLLRTNYLQYSFKYSFSTNYLLQIQLYLLAYLDYY